MMVYILKIGLHNYTKMCNKHETEHWAKLGSDAFLGLNYQNNVYMFIKLYFLH